MCGQLKKSRKSYLFWSIFSCIFFDRQAGKVLIIGARRRYKGAKNPGATAQGVLRGNNFTLAQARGGPDFISRGRRVEASQLLKGQSINF
jgi:hypothetical protein